MRFCHEVNLNFSREEVIAGLKCRKLCTMLKERTHDDDLLYVILDIERTERERQERFGGTCYSIQEQGLLHEPRKRHTRLLRISQCAEGNLYDGKKVVVLVVPYEAHCFHICYPNKWSETRFIFSNCLFVHLESLADRECSCKESRSQHFKRIV